MRRTPASSRYFLASRPPGAVAWRTSHQAHVSKTTALLVSPQPLRMAVDRPVAAELPEHAERRAPPRDADPNPERHTGTDAEALHELCRQEKREAAADPLGHYGCLARFGHDRRTSEREFNIIV